MLPRLPMCSSSTSCVAPATALNVSNPQSTRSGDSLGWVGAHTRTASGAAPPFGHLYFPVTAHDEPRVRKCCITVRRVKYMGRLQRDASAAGKLLRFGTKQGHSTHVFGLEELHFLHFLLKRRKRNGDNTVVRRCSGWRSNELQLCQQLVLQPYRVPCISCCSCG